jgi:hypothetical protein
MMQPHDLGSGQVPRLVSFLNPSDVPTAATTPSYSKRTIEAQHRIAGGAAKRTRPSNSGRGRITALIGPRGRWGQGMNELSDTKLWAGWREIL